jgi:hypothetical protein
VANESVGAPQWTELGASGIAATAVRLYWVASGSNWVLSETGPAAAVFVENPDASGIFEFMLVGVAPSGRRQVSFLRLSTGDVVASY